MSDLEKRVEALRTQVKAMGGGAKIFQEWLVKKLDALLVLPEAPDHMEIPDPPAIPTRTILHVGDEEYELSQAPREEEPEIRLKRYETTMDGDYVTVRRDALEALENRITVSRPAPSDALRATEEIGRLQNKNSDLAAGLMRVEALCEEIEGGVWPIEKIPEQIRAALRQGAKE